MKGNFFAASFSPVSATSEAFSPDKNGNMPFIGTLIAGPASATLINGTIFKRENYKVGQLYLCTNVESADNPGYDNVQIVAELSALELIKAKSELGEPVLIRPQGGEPADTVAETVEAIAEDEVVAD